jgi:hypothetical protein
MKLPELPSEAQLYDHLSSQFPDPATVNRLVFSMPLPRNRARTRDRATAFAGVAADEATAAGCAAAWDAGAEGDAVLPDLPADSPAANDITAMATTPGTYGHLRLVPGRDGRLCCCTGAGFWAGG